MPNNPFRITRQLFVLTLCTLAATASAQAPLPLADWRARMKENFFIPQPLPPLRAETHRRFTPAPGVRAEAVTYATQFGMRVPAILYLPDPLPRTVGGTVPALVVVNGHGGDKYSWYAWYAGILYARAGLAVLTYDPLGEGERNPRRESGTRAHDKIKGDERLGRRVGGLLMTDVMQAVSFLAGRPEVDRSRIAAAGYSLGSFILSITGAMDTRLRACVLVGGGNLDGPEEYWDKAMPMCQGLPYRSLSFLGDRPAAIYTMHADRGPTLIVNGAKDTVVAIPKQGEHFFDNLLDRTAKLRGSREGLFEFQIVPDVSHRPFFLTRPVVAWLETKLDLPNWSAAQIRAFPETRIGDWAARYGIAMDKLYSREEREGGTPALLDDVPGFQREDLSVFGAADWEAKKDTLIIDRWVAAARAAEAGASTGTSR